MSSRGTLSKRTSCPDPRLQLQRSKPGFFRDVLEEAGFISIVIRDYSENIEPALWLFYILAVVPFVLVRLFRLKNISSTLAARRGIPFPGAREPRRLDRIFAACQGSLAVSSRLHGREGAVANRT